MDASLQAANYRTAIKIDHSTAIRQTIYHPVINFFVTWSWNAQKPRTAPGLSCYEATSHFTSDFIRTMILGPGSRISKPRSSRRSQYSKALPNDLPRHWALMIAIAHAGPSSRFSRSRRRLGIDQASTHRRVASGCRSSYFSRSTFAEALQPHRCHGRQEGRLWINRVVANRSASRTR